MTDERTGPHSTLKGTVDIDGETYNVLVSDNAGKYFGGTPTEVRLCSDVMAEMRRGREAYGRFASLHEAFAVLAEEGSELWEIVRQRDQERDLVQLRNEAIQIAAVALRIAKEFGWEEQCGP